MSDKAKPFAAEERVINEKHFQVYEVCGSTKPVPKAYHIKVMRRYEATVRQLEEGLAAVTAERDAYKAFFDVWRGRNEAKRVAEIYEIYMGKPEWASALKAIADLEGDTSGGFAAAAGILADTWDGEPSEATIRRLRDGTPLGSECDLGSCAQCALQDTGACNDTVRQGAPPVTTKTIAETRTGEPSAVDAVEETP